MARRKSTVCDTQCVVCSYTARFLASDRDRVFVEVQHTTTLRNGKSVTNGGWVCKGKCSKDESVTIIERSKNDDSVTVV